MPFDGAYNIKVKTPMGSQKGTLRIKTDGNAFSGSIENKIGVSNFSGGTIAGNTLTWNAETKTPLGAMAVTYTATIQGDKISGEAKTPFGKAPMEGCRA